MSTITTSMTAKMDRYVIQPCNRIFVVFSPTRILTKAALLHHHAMYDAVGAYPVSIANSSFRSWLTSFPAASPSANEYAFARSQQHGLRNAGARTNFRRGQDPHFLPNACYL